ncbi:G-protein coupled receptor 146 isoform X1 [Homo sapiens]|uniref:G-protein coupled receptor 146 isoform X1 n=1 Tax=Homo sapiens TaxID=9606 RepID=UPI001FB1861B|nr:probable G-protein coupled receptor 146 isoform X1 [Homo sapiens]XP_047275821.1 probable G-protein coupled receptor 146 isoform X1 [Homo sapiens]
MDLDTCLPDLPPGSRWDAPQRCRQGPAGRGHGLHEPGYQKGGTRGQLCSVCSAVPSKHGPSFLEPGCKQQEGGAVAPAKGGRGPAGNLPEENKCLHPGALTRTRRRPGALLIRACGFAEKRSSAQVLTRALVATSVPPCCSPTVARAHSTKRLGPQSKGSRSLAGRHVELQLVQRHRAGGGAACLPGPAAGAVTVVAAGPGGGRASGPVLQRPAGAGQPTQQGQHDHAGRVLCQHGSGRPGAQRPGPCAPARPPELPVGAVECGRRSPRGTADPLQCVLTGGHVLHRPAEPRPLHRACTAADLHGQRVQHAARVRLRVGWRAADQLLLAALLHLQPCVHPRARVRQDAERRSCRRHAGVHRLRGASTGHPLRAGATLPRPQGGHAPGPGHGPAGALGTQAAGGHRVHAVWALDATLSDPAGAHGHHLAREARGRTLPGATALCEGFLQTPGLLQQLCDTTSLPLHEPELPQQAPTADEKAALRGPALLPGPHGGAAGAGVGGPALLGRRDSGGRRALSYPGRSPHPSRRRRAAGREAGGVFFLKFPFSHKCHSWAKAVVPVAGIWLESPRGLCVSQTRSSRSTSAKASSPSASSAFSLSMK